MAIDSHQEYKLRQLVRKLGDLSGKNTELVTVYVPADYDLINVINQLSEEQGTASNIKSKSTRKNVMDALEKAIQHLRVVDKTPPNGLALFVGNVSDREGVQDIGVWSVEPPVPLSIRLYRCDKEFILEPLEELTAHKDVYGLIAIDNKNATLATVKGDNYNVLKTLSSGYSGKNRAGGQSAQRFERIVREQSHNFKKRVADYAEDVFMPIIDDVRGIVVGGPAGTKNDFLDKGFLHHELQKKIITVKDTTYTDESGIRELIDAARTDLSDLEVVRYKNLMQKFMQKLVNDQEVAYAGQVDQAVEMGAVDTLLMSENLDEDEIDRLYEQTTSMGGKVEIMNDEFEEGYQLWNTFKGKAAILRYRIQ